MSNLHRDVYTIVAGDGKKDRWVKMGAIFLNRGGSESVLLDALPVNGKLQLRTPKPKDAEGLQAHHFTPRTT